MNHLRSAWLGLWVVASVAACGGSTTTLGAFGPPDASPDATSTGEGADAGQGDAAPSLKVTSVAVGNAHACALLSDGSIKCWGRNNSGQLGDGTKISASSPVSVIGLPARAASLSLGGDRTCALLSTGGVACWGSNSSGQVGNGNSDDQPKPAAVVGLSSGVVAIDAADGDHTCALLSTGGMKCWGGNARGELGDGTNVASSSPVAVSGLSSDVKSIAIGGGRSCALLSNGSLKCWGLNDAGQLGDGSKINRALPVEILGPGQNVTSVSVGWLHTCVLAASVVRCRGYNGYGELGDGSKDDKWSWTDWAPSVSSLGTDAANVLASLYHSCALRSSGGAVCWGGNQWGQVGDGTQTGQLAATSVIGLTTGVTALAVGSSSNCALLANGQVKCWGNNEYGELGAASTETCNPAPNATPCSTKPLLVSGLL